MSEIWIVELTECDSGPDGFVGSSFDSEEAAEANAELNNSTGVPCVVDKYKKVEE